VVFTSGLSATDAAVSAVTATGVRLSDCAEKPPHSTPTSASTKRMPVEMRYALLRSLDPTSRSATSHVLWAKDGALTFTG
jgi:hypothetical protein